jgi:hypothetical protein
MSGGTANIGSILRGMGADVINTAYSCNSVAPTCAAPSVSDLGATVEGSASSQQFATSAEWFPTLASVVSMEIWMKGPKVARPNVDAPLRIRTHNGATAVFLNDAPIHGATVSIANNIAIITAPGLRLEMSPGQWQLQAD